MSKKTKPAKANPAKHTAHNKHRKQAIEKKLDHPTASTEATDKQKPEGRLTKLTRISELLKRPEGATLDEIVAITGWQKHTARAAISHALRKKHGYNIVSDKPKDGKRIYKISDPEQ